ncbi:AraC family transcriptional regulator [Butyricicoccus pullicaecorum]|uniref:HTH araC/xylS-type domain-containing protein n=2 Tax=Butyricicoccus pullicaecorum TaxID=501571 RepID=R8VU36_9FIRM|nr:AraC family transcriptional regulator [Butyricicoccus pullicaecorum]EOQ35949.1 hypothetical protein HMPREF1526_02529 [Butyricicoccus pullicaecorum 1.2]OUP52020.1 AraC family transcriptional regulator [Butyricicoccus pullicaecorum]SKA61405.1 AraC-like ligand binding domain-containing protein [Butyricicoccus pullicaecorum DSM 23266]
MNAVLKSCRTNTERGVLPESRQYYNTPSAIARQLFYYPTEIGRYTLDTRYHFLDTSPGAERESHKNFMLIYIDSGGMEIFNDGRRALAAPGQIALINCRKPHHYRALRDTRMIFLHFDGANTAAFFDQIISVHSGKWVLSVPAGSHIRADLLHIFDAQARAADFQPHTPSESELSQTIYRILCELLVPPRDASLTPDQDLIAQAIRYILDHLFEPLSVEDVASAVSLSASHFSRLFKARTGYSPHEYIVLRRIDEAKSLLHTTSLSVKQIAFRVGYHSEVNFISSFTAKTGMSPAVFRRMPI